MDIEYLAEKTATDAIKRYLDNKKTPTNQHIILDRVFPVERRVRSIIGGLETSLGTKFWEKLAKEIARENGFSLLSNFDYSFTLG